MTRALATFLLAAAALPLATMRAAPAASAPEEINLLSFAQGAWIVGKPAEFDSRWSALRLLDERSDTGWASPQGKVGPQVMVVLLPERSVVSALEFDTAQVDGDAAGSRAARDVVVEVSATGATSGFEVIARAALQPKADRQRFRVDKPVEGRWLRLTIRNNHGATDYVELMEFRAYGEQKTRTPAPSLSGTYETNWGKFHLQQEGAAVSGCYEYDGGVLANGGIDGRVTRFTWVQGNRRGPAVLAFSPDGKEMLGLWWHANQVDRPGELWSGRKVSDAVDICPHWKPDAQGSQLANDLATAGRVRLYGINFDLDSDRIRPESKAALDRIVKLARDKPDWTFTIEGHTDATAGAAHNQALSEQRAAAVKGWLVAAGVAKERLAIQGLGASQPIADNQSAIGRAQNRRVELVRN